ncbi:MAG: hypothetical protein ACTSQE_07690 [Candidatus Heimdallarchaeaceae archaeon]
MSKNLLDWNRLIVEALEKLNGKADVTEIIKQIERKSKEDSSLAFYLDNIFDINEHITTILENNKEQYERIDRNRWRLKIGENKRNNFWEFINIEENRKEVPNWNEIEKKIKKMNEDIKKYNTLAEQILYSPIPITKELFFKNYKIDLKKIDHYSVEIMGTEYLCSSKSEFAKRVKLLEEIIVNILTYQRTVVNEYELVELVFLKVNRMFNFLRFRINSSNIKHILIRFFEKFTYEKKIYFNFILGKKYKKIYSYRFYYSHQNHNKIGKLLLLTLENIRESHSITFWKFKHIAEKHSLLKLTGKDCFILAKYLEYVGLVYFKAENIISYCGSE